MYALCLTGPEKFEYVEIDRPRPAAHEVLIKVHRVGICGTDIEMLRGTMPYFDMGLASYPVILGHEWSGTIEERGSAVESLSVGERVTGDVSIGCGSCRNCMDGSYSLCDNRQEVGLARGKDGAFAQYMTMPAKHCYRLPENVSLDDGSLVEPAATTLKAIRKAGLEPGATVYIAGDGPIGLLAMQSAKAFGATRVIVGGTDDQKLAKATELGAHETVNVREHSIADYIRDTTGGRGVDLALEGSGYGPALAECIEVARLGGTVSVVGIYEQPIENFNMSQAVVKDLDICCSLASPNSFRQTLQLMAQGEIVVAPLVSDVYELADAGSAFEHQQSGRDGRIKIQLRPAQED